MDAKQACDKLNGYNFQNRYLVGMLTPPFPLAYAADLSAVVLYHQPDKMAKAKEDLEARKENLERIKKQHGID
jgi:pre-mRNA branch site protein p14